jgi:hypothetical protein
MHQRAHKTPYAREAKNSGYLRIVKLSLSSEPLSKEETRCAEERHNLSTEPYRRAGSCSRQVFGSSPIVDVSKT